MCGRATLTASVEEIAEEFALAEVLPLAPRYNMAPGQPLAVVRCDLRARRLDLLQWGLRIGRAPAPRRPVINARAETMLRRSASPGSGRLRRGLAPVTGFYEWSGKGEARQPYLLRRKDEHVFALAAICDEGTETCAILTTSPDEVVAPLHDRMPLLIPHAAYALWLDPDVSDPARIASLLPPPAASELVALPVSDYVNHAAHDDPRCLEPLAGAAPRRQRTLW